MDRATVLRQVTCQSFAVSVVDSGGPKDAQVQSIRQVAPVRRHANTHCRQLVNAIEPSVYGGDAPYVKLYFDHLLSSDTPT